MPQLSFRARIQVRGVNPFVAVSRLRANAIRAGWKKPLPVLVRVNGEPKQKPWRINMMPAGGGAFYLYLHGDVRRASKTEVGDSVRITLAFDAAYRPGPEAMPSWFRSALSKNRKAKKAWDALTPSRKKEILRYLTALKSVDARTRNVARAVDMLAGKKGRFMARSW